MSSSSSSIDISSTHTNKTNEISDSFPLSRVQWLSPITYTPTLHPHPIHPYQLGLIPPSSTIASSSLITSFVTFINPAYAKLRVAYFKPEFVHHRVDYAYVQELLQQATWVVVLEQMQKDDKNIDTDSNTNTSSSPQYRLIGCLALETYTRSTDNILVGHSRILAVSPAHRSSGIAGAILRAAECYYRRMHCSLMEMTVWWPGHEHDVTQYPESLSSKLRVWYHKLGFRTTSSAAVKDVYAERAYEFLDGVMEDVIAKPLTNTTNTHTRDEDAQTQAQTHTNSNNSQSLEQ